MKRLANEDGRPPGRCGGGAPRRAGLSAMVVVLAAILLTLVLVVGAAADTVVGDTLPSGATGGATAGESGGPAGETTTTVPTETTTTLVGETVVTLPPSSTTTTVRRTTITLPPSTSPEILERLRQLELLAGKISAKQMEVYRAAIELDAIDEDLSRTIEEYNYRVLSLEEAKQNMARLERELSLSRGQLAGAVTALQDRVVGTYKSDTSVLEVILDTTDMADFIRRLGLLMSVVKSDRERVDEVNALRARADRLLDELSPQIYEVTTATAQLGEQKKLVEDKLAVRQAYVDQLSTEIRGLVDQQRQIAGDVVPSGFDVGAFLVGDGNAVVKTALRYLGIPYVWGGAGPATGFDCSGLVQYVFLQNGMYVPHYSGYQAQMGFEVPRDAVQPGDLVFFGNPVHHVGIYVGDDLFVHSPRTGDVVKVSRLSERADVSHIRRVAFLSVDPAPTATQ
ncbi:MAG: NlpC/P60 family protein [Thermoleophilia bacterium]|nr:NlpC/P60 family protein [Thermoleophilia bacterium]